MKKLRRVLIGLLLLVAAALILGHLLIPRKASRAALEATFQDQIRRLRAMAFDTSGQWNTSVESQASDRQLFNHPALLHASVNPRLGSHLIAGDRTFDWQSDISLPAMAFSSTKISRHWYSAGDKKISAVCYQSEITDKNHRHVGITLVADISKL